MGEESSNKIEEDIPESLYISNLIISLGLILFNSQ